MKIAGLQEITTAMEGGLRGLPRTQDGSLDELAQLMREKARLLDRRENWQRRIDHIDARLARIAAREKPLLKRVAGQPFPKAGETGHKERPDDMNAASPGIAAAKKPLRKAVAREDEAFPAQAPERAGHNKRRGEVLMRY